MFGLISLREPSRYCDPMETIFERAKDIDSTDTFTGFEILLLKLALYRQPSLRWHFF